MPPYLTEKKSIVDQNGNVDLTFDTNSVQKVSELKPHPAPFRWNAIRYYIFYHIFFFASLYCMLKVKWETLAFTAFYWALAILGITAGSHRLWAHKSYKAAGPLKAFLVFCHSISNIQSAFRWARDHRVHHKYSDTDADPHNANRGLWFSHMGWLMVSKHPEVKQKGKLMYLDDLYNDRYLMFGHKYFGLVRIFSAILIPIFVPTYFWGEYWFYAWIVCHFLVQNVASHASYSVNSFAHKYGIKPYDKSFPASHSVVSNVMSLGEGHHNYHHSFPADYSHGEFNTFQLHPYIPGLPNVTTRFLEFCSLVGLAYDLRRPSREMVLRKMARTGDGSLNDKIEKYTKTLK